MLCSNGGNHSNITALCCKWAGTLFKAAFPEIHQSFGWGERHWIDMRNIVPRPLCLLSEVFLYCSAAAGIIAERAIEVSAEQRL